MSELFDQMARTLAKDVPRRNILRGLAAIIGGAIFASVPLSAATNQCRGGCTATGSQACKGGDSCVACSGGGTACCPAGTFCCGNGTGNNRVVKCCNRKDCCNTQTGTCTASNNCSAAC